MTWKPLFVPACRDEPLAALPLPKFKYFVANEPSMACAGFSVPAKEVPSKPPGDPPAIVLDNTVIGSLGLINRTNGRIVVVVPIKTVDSKLL